MKLIRLRLENFRQHRESVIEFGDGMTAIVGANGTGKTTILEAITFALYGEHRKTRDTLKFYDAEPRTRVRVVLDFAFDGRTYSLERTDKDASLLDVTEALHVTKAAGLREVKGAAEKLLRLNYQQFKNSFFTEQKSLAFLQFNTDARRQEQVARMLGFDRLRLAGDLARKKCGEYRRLADTLAASLGNLENLKKELHEARERVKSTSIALVQMRDLAAETAKRLVPATEKKKLADEYKRFDASLREFDSLARGLKANVQTTEGALAKAVADEKRWLEIQPAEQEFVALEKSVCEMLHLRDLQIEREKDAAELTRLLADFDDAQKRLAAMKLPDLARLAKEQVDAQKALDSALAALKKETEAWQVAKAEAGRADAAAKQSLAHAVATLKKALELAEKGICPTCEQPTTASFEDKLVSLRGEAEAATAAHQAAIAALTSASATPAAFLSAEAAAKAVQVGFEEATAALHAAEKQHAAAKGIQAEIAAKQPRIGQLQKILAAEPPKYDREAHAALTARAEALRPLHREFTMLQDADKRLKLAEKVFAEAKGEFEKARSDFQALKTEQAKLPFANLPEAEAAIVDFEALSRKQTEASINIARAEAEEKLAHQSVTRCEEKIAELKESEAVLAEAKRQALQHEVVAKEMSLLREQLNAQIRPELEDRASDNLCMLTNSRYTRLVLDEDFEATIVEDDGTKKQVISGGEEDVVALALRLALSELIQERQGRPMSLLILDEVFGSLDSDRRQAVLERLQAIKNRFEQVLVISHIETINDLADRCIFLTRDEERRCTVVTDAPVGDDLMLV